MKRIRSFFNMIEITLALAVVGIGICGLMALLPVAVNSTRAAIGDSCASDAVNTFVSYIEIAAKNQWTETLSEIASGRPATGKAVLDDNTGVYNNWTAISETNSVLYKTGASGVYGVKMGNDFTAHVSIWKEPIKDFYYAESNIEIPENYAARLYIEVSWPVEAEYKNREKRVYVREIFKKN